MQNKNKTITSFEKGLTYFHKNDYESASDYFQQAIAEEPTNVEALYNMACCYAMRNDKYNAIKYLDKAQKIDPYCLAWSREDKEFDTLRNDPNYLNLVEKKSKPIAKKRSAPSPIRQVSKMVPVREIIAEEGEILDTADTLSESGGRRRIKAGNVNLLPPCIRCNGVIKIEERPRFHPYVSGGMIWAGLLLAGFFWMSLWMIAVGIPISFVGVDHVSPNQKGVGVPAMQSDWFALWPT